jgi:alpha-beta hydrolase superfamily lysophospholipase
VVTLAAQSYGVGPVTHLGPRCSILLLHGTADAVIPAVSSQYTYRIAQEPKRLILYPDAGHSLDEVADDVYHTVRDWLLSHLEATAASQAEQAQ